MLRVPLHKIQPGMILARPVAVPHDPYRYLLQRDAEIPMDLIPRLKRMGILEVWVRHRELEFLEWVVDEDLTDHQQELYRHVRQNFEAIIRDSTVELDLINFEESVAALFAFLKGSYQSNMLLLKLASFDNYLMSHSVNVCYLALLLGMKLDRYLVEKRKNESVAEAKNLHYLGLGCLLHDIGKLKVSPEILNKPGRLTDDEMAQIREHPLHGYNLMRDCLPESVAQIILNHHQRWNGQGYPAIPSSVEGEVIPPLKGDQIPVFARIASIADVYDAATTKRCYSEAKSSVRVLYEMKTQCHGFFDPTIEKTFYRTVPAFPIGQSVTLTNGIEAAVVDFNPDDTLHPKVQCLKTPQGEPFDHPSLEEIDLALYPELSIVAVDGHDVRSYVKQLEVEFSASEAVMSY